MSIYRFECRDTCSCGNRITWSGTWESLCIENELETIRITGNGKVFDMILAVSEYGDFLCIPSQEICLSISHISDTISIKEHLGRRLDWKDAVTIASALDHIWNHRSTAK